MARLLGVSLAAFTLVVLMPWPALAQLGELTPLNLPSELTEPDLADVVLIDDALLPPQTAWTYQPDVPEAKVEPLARPVSIDLPYNTRSIAFSAAPAAVVGA